MTLPDIVIVGQGRVGRALAAALGDVELVAARALPDRLMAAVYILAVRDPMIADTARAVLARHVGAAPVLLHTAGGVPSSVLREAGAGAAAVLHPLLAFAGDRPPTLRGALFAIEGDPAGQGAAHAIAARLGGRPLVLDGDQLARYHAAAVLASNHVLALVDLGRELLDGLGADPALAAVGLAGLFGAVADNLARVGLPRALTGPIARGDVEAVERHLAALDGEARVAYLATASRLCRIARDKGEADPAGLDAIEVLLKRLARID